jgi:hypothetical protein
LKIALAPSALLVAADRGKLGNGLVRDLEPHAAGYMRLLFVVAVVAVVVTALEPQAKQRGSIADCVSNCA